MAKSKDGSVGRRGFLKNAAVCTAAGAATMAVLPQIAAAQQAAQSNILFASAYSGNDLGAKINAALASLNGNPGEIWIDQSAGTEIDTAVVVGSSAQILRFVQGGIYFLNASLDVAHLAGSGFGGVTIVGRAPVVLVQADSANLAYMVRVVFDAGSIRDIQLVANKAKNPSALDAIVTSNRGVFFENIYVTTAQRHGIYVKSTTPLSNSAAAPRLMGVSLYQNAESGLRVEDATDPWILGGCLFEENGSHGIHLYDAAGGRILNSDIARNAEPGLFVQGTTGRLGSNQIMVIGNQFGQNTKEDIMIVGHDGSGYVSVANIIGPNQFWSGGNRLNNATDAVVLLNSCGNVVASNVFNSTAGVQYRSGIAAVSTGMSNADTWGPNSFIGSFGSGNMLPIPGMTQVVALATAQ